MQAGPRPNLPGLGDLETTRELLAATNLDLGGPGWCPEVQVWVRTLGAAFPELARMNLQHDIAVLSKVLHAGRDVVVRDPLGLREGFFPVRLRGQVVHCLASGKIKDGPLTAAALRRLAGRTRRSAARARIQLKAYPPLARGTMEQALAFCRRLRDGLEQALAHCQRAQDLMRQLAQSERMLSLGTLSGGVAHHFNNLLSIVLGYSSFVLNREELSREATDALHRISEAAQRGRRLTDEILALAGSDEESLAPCHVHAILENTLSLLKTQIGGHVRVETSFQARQDTVLAPYSSVRQVVFNLLTNATDSMTGGGVLAVITHNVTMQAGDGSSRTYLTLEVTDSAGALPKGFQDGAGAGAAPPANGDRRGLKLSSVYGIVGRLEGTVVLSSDPGTRTSVQVLLPLAAAGQSIEPALAVSDRLASKQIWVVDDDTIFRSMCERLLSDEGHVVRDFPGGSQLQDHIRAHVERPDLFILDFSMPEFNGLQLCEWLREQGLQQPVILVSGFSASQPDIRKALRLKKTFLLQKPFTARDLTDAVAMALGEALIDQSV